MCTAHKPVSKLLGKGDFKAFCPAGEHTAPMGWKWLSHAKFHPNTDLWCANFYFNNDMFCKQSNEVESRYLQNKVTSLQIESSCWAAGRASGLNWVLGYWHGYLSAARCEWFAFGPADVTATPSSLAPVKSEWFTFLVLAYPGCPGKKALNGCSSSSSSSRKQIPKKYLTTLINCYSWLKSQHKE